MTADHPDLCKRLSALWREGNAIEVAAEAAAAIESQAQTIRERDERIAELERALCEYGRHRVDCNLHIKRYGACDCGYAALARETK